MFYMTKFDTDVIFRNKQILALKLSLLVTKREKKHRFVWKNEQESIL